MTVLQWNVAALVVVAAVARIAGMLVTMLSLRVLFVCRLARDAWHDGRFGPAWSGQCRQVVDSPVVARRQIHMVAFRCSTIQRSCCDGFQLSCETVEVPQVSSSTY